MRRDMNAVIVSSHEERFRRLSPKIKKIAEKGLKYFHKKNCRLEIYLVSDGAIAAINKKFRKLNRPADVLSFGAPSVPWPKIKTGDALPVQTHLGEIYLAPDYIKSKGEDLSRIAIHGLLHILGFNHARKDDRIKMELRERALWQKIFS